MKCIACGNEEFELIHRGTRDRKDIDVYQCTSCGGSQLSTVEQIVDGFYENSGMHQDSRISDLSQMTILDDDRRHADMLRDFKGKLLDFGCGGGGILRLLKEQRGDSEELYGVELEDTMRNLLNGSGIQCKKLLSDFSEKFDLITMFHVMEHLTNPYDILQEVRDRLVDGGTILIETPNANDALITQYESDSFKDFTYWSCHVFLYTSRSLEQMLETVGFQINYSKQIQRYPLSNHLYWLSKKKPGGHNIWKDMNSDNLANAYYEVLKEKQMCDTLLVSASKKS